MPSTHQIGTAALVARLPAGQQTTHLENMYLALGSNYNIQTCSQRVRDIYVNVHVLSINPLSCTINHILVFCSITYKYLFLDSTSKVYVSTLHNRDRLMVCCWECINYSNLFLTVWNISGFHITQ